MKRKQFKHKMMNLVRIMRDTGVANGCEYNLDLGRALYHLRDADIRKGVKEYGGYKNMWNSKLITDLRNIYGC